MAAEARTVLELVSDQPSASGKQSQIDEDAEESRKVRESYSRCLLYDG